MKCTESEDEEPIKGKESQLQLSCFINQEVKYLATGLRLVSDPDGNWHASDLRTTAVSMVTGGIFCFCFFSLSRDYRRKSRKCPQPWKETPCI